MEGWGAWGGAVFPEDRERGGAAYRKDWWGLHCMQESRAFLAF